MLVLYSERSLCVCKFKYLPLLIWKSLCPLHRSVKSSLLHLQLPETWTSERLFNESVFAARCHGVQVSSCLLLQLYVECFLCCPACFSCMISVPIIRLAGLWLRLQANAWKTLAYKGSFLRGPLGDVWHLHGSWFAFHLGRVFWCWMLVGCFLVFLFGPNSCFLSLFLSFSFFPACLCQLEDNKEWKWWLSSLGVGQLRVFWKNWTH